MFGTVGVGQMIFATKFHIYTVHLFYIWDWKLDLHFTFKINKTMSIQLIFE